MKRIIVLMLTAIFGLSFVATPVFAEKCVLTSVIGEGVACNKNGERIHDIDENHPLLDGEYNCSCDNERGSSILRILFSVIDFLSIGIGVLAVLGITIVGVQYLTAGGSEEKTRKAKNRMTEIIIGLAIYAVFYAIIKWLHVAQ